MGDGHFSRRTFDITPYLGHCLNLIGIRAIPADRVLGDGMVGVDRAKLAQLIAEVDDALDRYESGNPIQAGELYSAFEALRANQGGVAT